MVCDMRLRWLTLLLASAPAAGLAETPLPANGRVQVSGFVPATCRLEAPGQARPSCNVPMLEVRRAELPPGDGPARRTTVTIAPRI